MTEQVSHSILTLLIFFPVAVALLLILIPSRSSCQSLHKNIAMLATIIEFVFSLHLIRYFVPRSYFFQFAQVSDWLPKSTGIKYIVGVDGLSLILVLLTTTLSMIVMLTTYKSIKTNIRGFLSLFLFLETTIIGVFTSIDVVLFYIFWEASLIPIYFIIGIWGGKERIYATTKFFIYGVIGSLFMLIALIYLYYQTGISTGNYSSNLLDIYKTAATLPITTQYYLFIAVTLAFAIKTPIFPFHTWLPDVYEQAPIMYLLMSGVILKLAAYGLIRFSLCLFPQAAAHFSNAMVILGLISVLYGALIAWRQTNIRRIMAFSSLSHLGFIIIGIFAFNAIALQGALYQMLNHAVTAAALFILFNFLFEGFASSDLNHFGGLAKVFPCFGFFFGLSAMAAVALPSTGNFIGEWMILIGSFQSKPILAVITTLGVVFGAVYILWVTYKIIFGKAKDEFKIIKGMNSIEILQMIILIICIYALGFTSSAILDHTQVTLVHIEQSAIRGIPYFTELTNMQQEGVLEPIKISSNSTQKVK